MSRKLLWLLLSATAILFGAAWAGTAFWRASTTLAEVRSQLDGTFAVAVRPWVAAIPPGLDTVGSPAEYVDAKSFHGNLYIAGPAGLAEYSAEGILKRRLRPGIELPPAPLTALATGLAGDSAEPELWIATAGQGLAAFDGEKLRHIRPDLAEHAKLTALLPVSTGRILLGTEKAGVLVWDGTHLAPFHASLAGIWVTALAGDDSDLWIGTLDRGLLHWRAGALQPVNGSLPDPRILSLATAPGHVFAGTAAGIADIEDNVIRRILARGFFAQALAFDQGKLWMGTLEEGYREVPLTARVSRTTGEQCPHCNIRKLFREGEALYTLSADSLYREAQQVLAPAPATLKHRNIAALAADAAGRLWIGYFDRGLEIQANGTRVAEFEDDHLFCVNRIAHDASGRLTAVATANGLVLFDAAARQQKLLTQADGLIANQITDVLLGPDSIAAATPAGVSFIRPSGVESVYAFQGLVNNHVFALASDGPRLLAGTLGGLSMLDAGLVKASYTTANSALPHNWITAIQTVGQDHFIGTYGAGVLRLEPAGRWGSFPDLPKGLEININAMTVSPRAVYAGTLDKGVAIYNRSTERWSLFTSGLPSANVTALDTRGGVLWIGTDNGLVRVPESSLLP